MTAFSAHLRCCTAAATLLLLAGAGPVLAESPLREQVLETERAFARTMAERDFEAFQLFLADEAVFFSGEGVLRGRQQVAAAWSAYFEGAEAPFSWAPRVVEVLDSGALALSSGPVFGPDGTCVATFSSVWRREASGDWKIVFDKGSPHCE